MSKILLLLIILTGKVFLLGGSPLPDRYIVEHYTIDNGILQSSVNALNMDRNGFLWIGTFGGLSRFDGRQFYHYTSNNSVLTSDRINKLTKDRQGRICLSVIKPGEQFYYIDENYDLQKQRLRDDQLYILMNGCEPLSCDSFIYCRDIHGSMRRFPLAEYIQQKKLFFATNQHLYFKVHDSAIKVDYKSKQFEKIVVPSLAGYIIINNHILAFDRSYNLSVWKEGKMVKELNATQRFKDFSRQLKKHGKTALFDLEGDGKSGFLRLGDHIWYLTFLDQLDAQLLYSGFNPLAYITAMYYDENKQLFFMGTATEGLYVIRKNPFETIFFQNREENFNSIYSQLRINQTTVVNRSFFYKPESGTYTSHPQSLAGTGFCKTSDGRIWYSAAGNFCIADSQFHLVRKIPIKHTGAGMPELKAIQEDAQGIIWFCTENSFGYIQGDQQHYILLGSSLFDDNNISTLFLADDQKVWIGYGDGILIYNKITEKIEKKALEGKPVVSVFRAKDNSIWISTYGKGIYRYIYDRFVPLPLDQDKKLLFSHSFIEDKNGFFWIPTNKGLVQCKKEALDRYAQGNSSAVYYFLHRKAGIYTDEFNSGGNPTYIYFNNKVFIPSIKGVLSFRPEDIRPLLPDNEILIERIAANSQEIKVKDEIILPPGKWRIELNISAPYFGDPTNNIVEYQLTEVSDQWLPYKGNEIVYTNLSDGTYHLKFRKRTGFGAEDFAYKKVKLTVQPFWYEMVWARVTGIGLLAGIIFFIIRKRIISLKAKQLLLERKVAERTATLNNKMEELDASERELYKMTQIQEQAIAVILHDIRSPLNYLSLLAKNFNRNISRLSQEELTLYSQSLVISSSNIVKFSNDLLEWLSLNHEHETLHNEPIDLGTLLVNIKELYHDIAAINHTTIEIGVIEKNILSADWNKLYLVIRNLVDNASKHCKNGKILLSVSKDMIPGYITISVSDNGNGVAASELRHWKKYSDKLPDFRKDKLGLSMVHCFIRIMNGKLDITSEMGKGTTIKVYLPG